MAKSPKTSAAGEIVVPVATQNSGDGSNDAANIAPPAAIVEGAGSVDAPATEAPEPATGALPQMPEASPAVAPPAAIVEGAGSVDAPATEAPEPATGALPQMPEANPADAVICRVRAVGGPRRRAGLAFDETPRSLTRADLGETDEKIEEALKILISDPRLAILPLLDD